MSPIEWSMFVFKEKKQNSQPFLVVITLQSRSIYMSTTPLSRGTNYYFVVVERNPALFILEL